MSTTANKIVRFETEKLERKDPLLEEAFALDRVFYALGVLLDATDFSDEQTYHRRQLARALLALHGSGTVAGLLAEWKKADPAKKTPEELRVQPGLGLDRMGRLIVIPRTACIRLSEWFASQPEDALKESFYTDLEFTAEEKGQIEMEDGVAVKVTLTGVLADLFVRFIVCERGKTPSFAAGPFDALDAVEPARLREGYELQLIPSRKPLRSPAPFWPSTKDELHTQIFSAWQEVNKRIRAPGNKLDGMLEPLVEHQTGQDTSFVFLARVLIPATKANDTATPVRANADVRVFNLLRPFVYNTTALARLSGL